MPEKIIVTMVGATGKTGWAARIPHRIPAGTGRGWLATLGSVICSMASKIAAPSGGAQQRWRLTIVYIT